MKHARFWKWWVLCIRAGLDLRKEPLSVIFFNIWGGVVWLKNGKEKGQGTSKRCPVIGDR